MSKTIENTTSEIVTTPEAEAQAYLAQVSELAKVGNGLKPEALAIVAKHLGRSANKFGRPDSESFVAFILAMAARNLSMNARVGLAQTANGSVGTFGKPVFAIRAKAGSADGSLSYKLNMPAQFEAVVS